MYILATLATIRAVAVPMGTARSRRLRWLEGRVLRRLFDVDPPLLAMTASETRASIMDVRRGLSGEAPEPMIGLSSQPLHEDLPQSVYDELARDPGFMAVVGLKIVVLYLCRAAIPLLVQ